MHWKDKEKRAVREEGRGRKVREGIDGKEEKKKERYLRGGKVRVRRDEKQ